MLLLQAVDLRGWVTDFPIVVDLLRRIRVAIGVLQVVRLVVVHNELDLGIQVFPRPCGVL